MQVTARVNNERDFIELFFWSNGELMSYSFRESHAPSTLEYMRTRTSPAKGDPRAEKVFRYWCGLPGGDPLDPPRLVSRLTVGGAR